MADGFVSRINADPVDQVPVYAAQHERLFDLMRLAPGATGLTAKTGRRLGSGLELAVAGDSSSVTVQPGVCTIGSPNATGGPYIVAVNAAKTITMPAKPGAGLQRRDLVVVRVYDEDVAEAPTTLREARVELVTGSAAASPSNPAQPVLTHVVGVLNTTNTATTIVAGTIEYAWGSGGIGVVGSVAERNALGLFDGLMVYRSDLSAYQARIAGAWQTIATVSSGSSPYLSVQHNASTSRNPGQTARIAWAVTNDALGGCAISGSQITGPVGIYQVNVMVTAQWETGQGAFVEIRRNSAGSYSGGSGLCRVTDNGAGSGAGNNRSLMMSKLLTLNNAGDHFEVWLGLS